MNISQARRNLIALQQGEHCHDYAQVLIGWRGQMDCEFFDKTGRLINGSAALVPASASHLYKGLAQESELLVIDISFEDPFIEALQDACKLDFSQTLFQTPDFLRLDISTLTMLDFAARQLAYQHEQYRALISCQLVSLFMTQIAQCYTSEIPQSICNSRLILDDIDRLIDNRMGEPPNNIELAALSNLSESHFYCIFQRQVGLTPQQYVMNRRLQRSLFLLQNSKMSLSAISSEIGFADASSFCRAFKKQFKCTPGSARDRQDPVVQTITSITRPY